MPRKVEWPGCSHVRVVVIVKHSSPLHPLPRWPFPQNHGKPSGRHFIYTHHLTVGHVNTQPFLANLFGRELIRRKLGGGGETTSMISASTFAEIRSKYVDKQLKLPSTPKRSRAERKLHTAEFKRKRKAAMHALSKCVFVSQSVSPRMLTQK